MESAGLEVDCGRLVVVVGPNNAGKSLLLRELAGMDRSRRTGRWGGAPGRDAVANASVPGRLVASVRWSDDIATMLGADTATHVIRDDDEVSRALRVLPWASLLETVALGEAMSRDLRLLVERVDATTETPIFGPLGRFFVATIRDGRHGPARTSLDAALQTAGPVFDRLGVPLPTTHELEGVLDRVGPPDPKLGPIPALFAVATKAGLGHGNPDWELVNRLQSLASWCFEPDRWSGLRSRLEAAWSERGWGQQHAPPHLRTVLYLDGLARLSLTEPAELEPYGSNDEVALPLRLLDDQELRERLRALVHDGLGAWLVVDMHTESPGVVLRLSKVPPPTQVEVLRGRASLEFMQSAEDLRARSDGTQAYVGMLAAIATSRAKVVFIDEPEAFLHPPLARTFARQLASMAREGDRQVFVATHSPDIVAGSLATDASTKVIRLAYGDGTGFAWHLERDLLRRFSLNPRLRSAQALSGLFAEVVVVCEGDADRAFYQEVRERLAEDRGSARRGDGWVFLNAQNWQTEREIIGPLRRMGVAAAAIIDLDVLGESELKSLLDAALVPPSLYRGWLASVGELKRVRGIQHLKASSLSMLDANDRKVLDSIIRSMAEWGVFVVPVGELEDWLGDALPARPKDKHRWITQAFEYLGDDPESSTWKRPEPDGVWRFLRSIESWAGNAEKHGLP